MNTYNFNPKLFDIHTDGVYRFESVLAYHRTIEHHMPIDGLTWLCDHPNLAALTRRVKLLEQTISALNIAIEAQPYQVWVVLTREINIRRCRLQLLELCIMELYQHTPEPGTTIQV